MIVGEVNCDQQEKSGSNVLIEIDLFRIAYPAVNGTADEIQFDKLFTSFQSQAARVHEKLMHDSNVLLRGQLLRFHHTRVLDFGLAFLFGTDLT